MKHYIVNGKPQSGKDTFVDEIVRLMEKDGMEAVKISSVDKVKKAAYILGWDGVKDAKGRKFLSDLKDMSTLFYNGPFEDMKEWIYYGEYQSIFFFIREPEEIQKLIDAYPPGTFETICMIRSDNKSDDYGNHADNRVYNFRYDYQIYNDGELNHLMKLAKIFYESNIKPRIRIT